METQPAIAGRAPTSTTDARSVRSSAVQRELGQFLTPRHIADLMASMFLAAPPEIRLLDAGAGTGNLTEALVRHLCAIGGTKRIIVTAYELDVSLIAALRDTYDRCQQECERAAIEFTAKVHNEDFVSSAVSILRGDLFSSERPLFNSAIVNPPYRKLRSDSRSRLLLRSIGIETSNFYSAFTALIIRLLVGNGELVAITPRSFCNGPYFRPFRTELLDSMSLRRLHLFESRSAAFGKDNVLQENLILHAVKEQSTPHEVMISSSSGQENAPVKERLVGFPDVVAYNDPERIIHIRVKEHQNQHPDSGRVQAKLSDLGLSVSTGRVVDFRAKIFLRRQPAVDTAPLIYPSHFDGATVAWPKEGSRKPNALLVADQTRALLVPSAFYVLVKRFTSKEERRRIVASVYDPKRINAKWVAFENHLNYFHVNGGGLSRSLAKGLAAFLNSTLVDSYFREFSGHTQVNAADLRRLTYPSKAALEELGRKIQHELNQAELDKLVEANLY
ncbi:MAG: adenine-specific DNA-methyltransferase [Blastocatellia bacterium]|nr:adenine-specific DNA-methyltransferase [Blastocatellia bacterium]